MKWFLCVASLLVFLQPQAESASVQGQQAAAVKGRLLCGSAPAKDVPVKLYRVPQVKKDDPNEVLDERSTGPDGMFHLEGNTNGFRLNSSAITDGVLSVYHNCDGDAKKDPAKDGYRRFNIHIPEEYVSLGGKAKKTLDVGTINLQVIYPNEKAKVKIETPKKE